MAKPPNTQHRSRGNSRVNHGKSDESSGDGSDDDDDPPQYLVERLVNHRLKKGCKNKLEFLVRWKGYGPESDTWEPRGNIEGSLVQDYTNETPA